MRVDFAIVDTVLQVYLKLIVTLFSVSNFTKQQLFCFVRPKNFMLSQALQILNDPQEI